MGSPCMDLLNWVEPDMMLKILSCLDDPSDLVRVGIVSKSWRNFVVENSIWKQFCLRMFPQLSRVSGVVELKQNETEGCSEVGSSSSWMEREERVYAFLARNSTSFNAENCILEAIRASSTDNYPEESIVNTLDPNEVVGQRASYWSSEGQNDDRVPETLLYKLVSDLCVITEISIHPFQAFFQLGLPIYSAKAVRFRMGHAKYPLNLESDSMDESWDDDDKFVWTYTSQIFEMDQESCLQNFKLPEPVLSIGGYLQIELLGRVQKQEMDGLFYICVSHVQVSGHPLGPWLDAEIVDPSGNIVLKRDLRVDTLSGNGTESMSLSSTSDNLEKGNQLERRVRTLEQILEILRGNEFVYGWPEGDDESDEE